MISAANRPSHPWPPKPETPATRRVSAAELFSGARELRIAHAGEEYRLTITRNGKLILTK